MGEPTCPKCGREGYEAGGMANGRWEKYREPITLENGETIFKYGERLVGNVPMICIEGHRWSAPRPPHLSPKRPQRPKPRRGFY